MKTGFVCRATGLSFVGSPMTIPAYYFDCATRLVDFDKKQSDILGTESIKSVISETHEQAEKILCQRVGDVLRSCGWWSDGKLKVSDFRFRIHFSEIKNGQFWHNPSSTYCHEYTPV